MIPRLLALALGLGLALSAPSAVRAAAPDAPDAPGPGVDAEREPAPPPDAATTAAPPSTERPALEPAGAATTAAPAEPAPDTGDGNWLDVGHAFIEHRVFAPALRVDRFFSDERDLESVRARSFVQLRMEFRFTQYTRGLQYSPTITANLKLPGLNQQLRRLQIEVSGQGRDAFNALIAPGDRTTSSDPTTETNFHTTDAGVGFRVFDTLATTWATHGDLGAGFIFTLPPGVYGRARLRFVESLGARVLSRQALTGFWRTDTLFGSTGSAELERPVAWGTLVRLSGSTTITERSRGFEWSGDLSLIGTYALRIGAQLGFSISGATEAPVSVDVYRTYLRLRRDVYRRWIFAELTPEYDWPWHPIIGRRGIWSVAFRLEVQFQGNEAPRPPPWPTEPDRAGDPEPRDPP